MLPLLRGDAPRGALPNVLPLLRGEAARGALPNVLPLLRGDAARGALPRRVSPDAVAGLDRLPGTTRSMAPVRRLLNAVTSGVRRAVSVREAAPARNPADGNARREAAEAPGRASAPHAR